MPLVNAGDVNLHYEERGQGEIPVIFLHGNLGCGDWMHLVWPLLPENLRVIAIEWRGCGGSDKPPADADFANYSMEQHARDMLAAMATLGISKAHLCGHSTGGIIALHMLWLRPQLFGKALFLDPVGPMGLNFEPVQREFFAAMKANAATARQILATAMPTLFEPQSLTAGPVRFAEHATAAQRRLFDQLIEKTRVLSDGIWFGTIHNLTKEWQSAALRARQGQIPHEMLVLWGALDQWIPRAHVEEMASRMPNCRLQVVPGVGHAMNVEQPDTFARYFIDFFLGAATTAAPRTGS